MDKRKNKPVDLSSLVYGKVPPQSKELEEAILGAIMLEREAFSKVHGVLKPEAFYVDAHQRIYKAMQTLSFKNQPIDILTVREQLLASEELDLIGGPYYITQLTNTVVSSANIEVHSQIVLQKHIRREVIRVCGEALHNAYDDSVEVPEIASMVETELTPLLHESFDHEGQEIGEVLMKAIQVLEEGRNRKEGELIGIPSNYRLLDGLTGGWRNTDLVILAARPACGKTAMALNLAIAGAEYNNPIAFFSFEMSAVQLVNRLLAMKSDIFLNKIRDARIDESEMQKLYTRGIQPLAGLGLVIDDKAGQTVHQFKARLKKYQKKYGIKQAYVDYLQLMSGGRKGGNREQEISEISRELKITAKELNIPIIALSQLSRDVEKRKTAKSVSEPQLADLRESGAIEQDADIVMFLFNPNSDDEQNEDLNLSGDIVLKIAKHRAGSLEKVQFQFNKPVQRFEEVGLWRPHTQTSPIPKTNWQPVTERPSWAKVDSIPTAAGLPNAGVYQQQNNEDDPF